MADAKFTLGMGTFRLKGDEAYQSVKMALEEGYRHIDTAQFYGNEAEVGQAINDSGIARDQLFITTKVWFDSLTKEAFLPSVKASLQKLKTEYVDLLLIHWPSPEDKVGMSVYLNELKLAQEQGLTRHIGISNFTIQQTRQAIEILGKGEIFTNQVEVHPYLQNNELVEFCQTNDIIVTAYMPYAVGKVLKDGVLNGLADKYGVTTAQLVLQWLAQRNLVTIPSSTKRKNLASNIESVDIKLTDEDMSKIATLNKNAREANPDFAPEWDVK